jgi:hypothetical protein
MMFPASPVVPSNLALPSVAPIDGPLARLDARPDGAFRLVARNWSNFRPTVTRFGREIPGIGLKISLLEMPDD